MQSETTSTKNPKWENQINNRLLIQKKYRQLSGQILPKRLTVTSQLPELKETHVYKFTYKRRKQYKTTSQNIQQIYPKTKYRIGTVCNIKYWGHIGFTVSQPRTLSQKWIKTFNKLCGPFTVNKLIIINVVMNQKRGQLICFGAFKLPFSGMCAWDNHYCWPGRCNDELLRNCMCQQGFDLISNSTETSCQRNYYIYYIYIIYIYLFC